MTIRQGMSFAVDHEVGNSIQNSEQERHIITTTPIIQGACFPLPKYEEDIFQLLVDPYFIISFSWDTHFVKYSSRGHSTLGA